MPRQKSSVTSTNWREPQAPQTPTTDEVHKASRALQSLSMTDGRRNRGSVFSNNLPTIEEDVGFTTVMPKKMRGVPAGLQKNANPLQPQLEMAGASTSGPSCGVNRPPSMSTSNPGSSSWRSRTQGTSYDSRTSHHDQSAKQPNSCVSLNANINRYHDRSSNAPSRRGSSSVPENVQQPRKHPKELFQVGTIIRAPLHEEDFNGTSKGSNITMSSEAPAKSSYGAVFTKMRVMIVTARFQNHYIAVPLYTHNGNGLSKKTPEEQREYVSIRDHRIDGGYVAESIHGCLTTGYLKSGIHILDAKSAAHIPYPVARKYDLPVVHHGNLTAQATSRLVELYTKFSLNNAAGSAQV